MARSAPYSAVGPYRTGVWLVSFPSGAAGVYNKNRLPTPSKGVRYYWLGSTPKQANSRIPQAIGSLDLSTDFIPSDVTSAFAAPTGTGRPIGIEGNIPVVPFGGLNLKAPQKAPGATYPTGPAQDFFSGVGDTINSTEDFLKFISWIFHPRNLLRAVELLVGLVFMIFGLHAAFQARGERTEGFVTSENALSRSELGRVATELGRAAKGRTRPAAPRSAPHVTRRRALAQRYTREERVRQRERKGEKPAGHAKATKGSGAGTRKSS